MSASSAGSEGSAAARAVQPRFDRAVALHQQGHVRAAQSLYREILQVVPRHALALQMLALATHQSGDPRGALGMMQEALRCDPDEPTAHLNLGNLLLEARRPEEALASYSRALHLQPQYVEALFNRANVLAQLGRLAESLADYDAAIALRPDFAGAHYNRAQALRGLGRHEDALASYDLALNLQPDYFDAITNRGAVLRDLKRFEEARACFERAAALRPRAAGPHNNLGVVLLDSDHPAEALASFERALSLDPTFADALGNKGSALRALHRFQEALACYDRALQLDPGDAVTVNNRGNALLRLMRPEKALECYELALRLKPGFAEAHNNRCTAFLAMQRHREALASADEALRLQPDFGHALFNRALALMELSRHGEAADSLDRLIEVQPDRRIALGLSVHCRMHCYDWRDHQHRREQVVAAVMDGYAADTPLSFLSVSGSAAQQLECARIYAAREHRDPGSAQWNGPAYSHPRLRIAYISADYRFHPLSYLMAGVFERHDRRHFEVIGIGLMPKDGSPVGERVIRAFDRFMDASRFSDDALADWMREQQIDVAVDLMGYTQNNRLGLFTRRPAPVQVNYLGFPATVGSPCLDYILADRFVIPAASKVHYTEQVAYLPECFQANDDQRAQVEAETRAHVGLAERALVLCCFNNSYKISPALFDIWCRLLKARPDAVLWVLARSPDAQERLLREAEQRGVSRKRLVFSERVPYTRYLARIQLADLFLDTLPFNGGTTASDFLAAGVPVLTCAGDAFAARMAGSLLNTLALPELITDSLEAYERRALELLGSGALLKDLRARLAATRHTSPLYKTRRFTRHLELAYETMVTRARAGAAPQSFAVEPVP